MGMTVTSCSQMCVHMHVCVCVCTPICARRCISDFVWWVAGPDANVCLAQGSVSLDATPQEERPGVWGEVTVGQQVPPGHLWSMGGGHSGTTGPTRPFVKPVLCPHGGKGSAEPGVSAPPIPTLGLRAGMRPERKRKRKRQRQESGGRPGVHRGPCRPFPAGPANQLGSGRGARTTKEGR